MYAAVASYMCQAWRLLKLELERFPSYWVSVPLAAAGYLNFFTHRYLYDFRWYIIGAVFLVFLTLQVTECLLTAGFFTEAHGGSPWLTHAGGWAGILTAAVAWYASAAGVMNGTADGRVVLPVGGPLWERLPMLNRFGSPAYPGA